MNDVLFSHNSDNWKTPTELYNVFINNGFLDLFPYCSNLDQYEIKYKNSKLFINPPYSDLNKPKFKKYITELINCGNDIYLLIPSRTDTKIFHYLLDYCVAIYFIKGRLHFNDSNLSAPFPSCILQLNHYRFLASTMIFSYDYFNLVKHFDEKL